MSLRDAAALTGIGETDYTRGSGRTALALSLQAALEAIRDAFPGSRIADRLYALPAFRTVGEFELPLGAVAPAQHYAPMARRHMELYGTAPAEIAVATRRHAVLNPRALMRKPLHPGAPSAAPPNPKNWNPLPLAGEGRVRVGPLAEARYCCTEVVP